LGYPAVVPHQRIELCKTWV